MMASFTNRGTKAKPSWQYTINHYVGDKRRPIYKGGFKTKREAQLAAAEVESNLSKKGGNVTSQKIAFEKYFKDWLDLYKPDISKSTRARYLSTHKSIKEYFNSRLISDITRQDYQRFLNDYAKTRKRSTVVKLNSHIRTCVRDAVDNHVISLDFTRNAKMHGKTRKNEVVKYLDYEDSLKLTKYLGEVAPGDGPSMMILLGLMSGMRFGEVVGLTRDDVNFNDNTIRINKSWGYNSDADTGHGLTKTDSSNRVIKMDEVTMRVLKKHLLVTPDNLKRLIFFNPHSKYKVISNVKINKTLKSILKELKIDSISFHGLRHTHASTLIYKKNVSIEYIADRLGHSTTETTHKHYAHLLKELKEEDEKMTNQIFKDMYS